MERKDTSHGARQETEMQDALENRLHGKLVTVDILGHLFYVDIPMGMLRPKDDFTAPGIKFNELSDYLNEKRTVYQIPYDPTSHSFLDMADRRMRDFHKDTLFIEFPHQRILDPVGYSRKYGLDLRECLQETGIRSHFIARRLNGNTMEISKVLRETLSKQAAKIKQTKSKRKGRRI